jgi:maltose alpha-D-glucosyltransferase/alpha-amylase
MDEHRQEELVPHERVIQLPSTEWLQVLSGDSQTSLERLLAETLGSRRWFASKTRAITSTNVLDAVAIEGDERLLLVEVRYREGSPEIYLLSLAFATGQRAERLQREHPSAVLARVETGGADEAVVLYEPLVDEPFCAALLRLVEDARSIQGSHGEVSGWRTDEFERACHGHGQPLAARVMRAEQSNTSIVYGDRLILKLFRRLETGLNPDLEISAHLTRRGFQHTPPVAGAIKYRHGDAEPWSLASLQRYVPNQGDAWQYTLASLEPVLAPAAVARPLPAVVLQPMQGALLSAARQSPPSDLADYLGSYLADAERLGARTGDMHLALAQAGGDGAFTPEPLTPGEQQGIAQRTRALIEETFDLLRRHAPLLAGETLALADNLLDCRARALSEVAQFAGRSIQVERIRCHGDYHLGQVLVTASGDFTIIDFEGEPARPLAERRNKQLALRDVAGMIRSFHYASCTAATAARKATEASVAKAITERAAVWYFWTSAALLRAYRATVQGARFVPQSDDEFERVLNICLLEKAVYELRYELNNRPDWAYLPLVALVELLG